MSELQSAMRLLNSNFPTCIMRYPTGKYGIVGNIPIELTQPYGGLFPGRKSMVWETEKEAINALIKAGIDRFQLSDCSWYVNDDKTAAI